MAAKFTRGDSIGTTIRTAQKNPPANVRTRSRTLRSGTTMAGMPGYINASPSVKMAEAKGGPGCGPHREGPIGEKGGSGAKSMAKAGNAPGMTTRNYKSSSTGKAAPLEGNSNMGGKHIHTANRGKMPGQKAPPTSRGILGGTVQRAGLNTGKGKMEKLYGMARTSMEGRRKSNMY